MHMPLCLLSSCFSGYTEQLLPTLQPFPPSSSCYHKVKKLLDGWLFPPYYCHRGWGTWECEKLAGRGKRTIQKARVAIREGWPVTHLQRVHDPLLGLNSQAGKQTYNMVLSPPFYPGNNHTEINGFRLK